jgi:hypothetical protein
MAFSISPEIRELAQSIAASEKADIYLYSGPINENGFGSLIGAFKRQHDAAILILTTNGGSANAAYRIARWLQTIYGKFTVLICSYCKSAGTLIATGACRLIMSRGSGELGPLDVQLNKRDELWEQRSGLTLRNALTSLEERAESLFTSLMVSIKTGSRGSVRFKLAAELAGELTKGLFAPIYEQITPEGLGEDYQELQVAVEYGKRLAKIGRNIDDASINRLVHEYPSHDFVIDAAEARTLFTRVDEVSSEMVDLALKLQDLVFAPDSTNVTVLHLSKLDEQKSDEAKDKGAPDATAQASSSDGSAGSSGNSA